PTQRIAAFIFFSQFHPAKGSVPNRVLYCSCFRVEASWPTEAIRFVLGWPVAFPYPLTGLWLGPPWRTTLMLRALRERLVEFVKSEDGPTAVEYAVMLALIIIVCLLAIQILGTNANSAFKTVGQSVGKTVSS